MNITMPAKPIQQVPLNMKAPVLKVIGLGGGGSNAINRMIELGLSGVDFIAANTDAQALRNSLAPVKIQLGPQLTRGLGAGGNPDMGEGAAEETIKDLKAALQGADMVFLAAGMGGGTGTGSVPVVARVARSLGAVTVAIVTMPFAFEVGRRQKNAREGLAKLRPFTDTLITIPNDRLLKIARPDLTLEMAFRLADDVLRQGIQGITELITQPGLINVDFSHVRRIMQNGGGALLSIGVGEGEGKARKAIEYALHHPLIEAINLENATGIIANFTGGSDLTFFEVMDALSELQERTNGQAEIVPGVIDDARMHNRTQVILVITGLGATAMPISLQPRPAQAQAPVASQADGRPIAVAAMPVRETAEAVVGAVTDLDLPAFMRRRVR